MLYMILLGESRLYMQECVERIALAYALLKKDLLYMYCVW